MKSIDYLKNHGSSILKEIVFMLILLVGSITIAEYQASGSSANLGSFKFWFLVTLMAITGGIGYHLIIQYFLRKSKKPDSDQL